MTDLDNDPDLILARAELHHKLDRHKVEFDWTNDLVQSIENLVDIKLALMLEALADRAESVKTEETK